MQNNSFPAAIGGNYLPGARGLVSRTWVRWWGWLVVALILGIHSLVRADDSAKTFEQANKLYEQGKFAAAVTAYENLVKAGQVSPALYFNLGNAEFKAGQTGLAIANYLRAERLAPRDPDIAANLKFARGTVSGATAPGGSRWAKWVERLTVDEWTVMTGIAAGLWFLLLAAGQARSSWRQSFRGYTATVGVAAGLLAVVLALAWRERFGNKTAVVIAREAVVRFGPLEESQSHYTVHDGAELAVLDHKDAWLQVVDGAGRSGWLLGKQVLVVD
ncbi:MAG TPA: tetratricopeptide repeat protein [Verrucomicrobiae bacterium]|nr:tetratricopeptide repeat protein [Verrucomicrobiae bacterium]